MEVDADGLAAPGDDGLRKTLDRLVRLLPRLLVWAEEALENGEGGTALKAASDQMTTIVRVIEKIQALKKVLASEAEAQGTMGPAQAEREALRRRVERWIDERAEERVARLLPERDCECGRGEGGGNRSLTVGGANAATDGTTVAG